MKQFWLLFIAACMWSCNVKNQWPKTEREKFTNGCVTKAMNTSPGLQDTAVTKYCECYQQKMETKYPDVKDLEKVNVQELTEAATGCLEFLK